MTRGQKICHQIPFWMLVCAILVFILFIAYRANAEPGFHRITENYEAKQETYLEVIGEVGVDVLDEEGKPTGQTITRPVTEEKTRYWTEKTISQGGTGIMFTNFGSGVTSAFLGLDVRELIVNGHIDIARQFTDITYQSAELDVELRPIIKRVSFQQWVAAGRPAYLDINPRYHYYGTPSITLTKSEKDKITAP